MKICHVCGETFEDYVEVCSDCGAVLKTEEEMKEIEQKEKEEAQKLIKNPVLVESVGDVLTAEIFTDLLKEANIPFFCDEENTMHSGFGGSFFAMPFYVDEKNLAAASQIFKDLTESDFEFDDDDFDDGFFDDAEV